MAKIRLKQVDQISRKKVSDAYDSFMQHCKFKNLAPYSILYYEKNVGYFLESLPQVKYADEITQEKIADFVSMLMDRGNRVTAINARLRAVFVFLRYCFEQEYLDEFPLSQIKEDESFKEPYSDAELQRLLKQPEGDTWAEWRMWAVINLLVATGVRASTVVNIKLVMLTLNTISFGCANSKTESSSLSPCHLH